MSEDVRTVIALLSFLVACGSLLYTWSRNNVADDRASIEELETIRQRVYGLETKVGLFWHLVEEHMSNMLPHGNPIHLSMNEQADAKLYNIYKAKTPTHILLRLMPAIERELSARTEEGKHSYMSADEIVAFTCILGAIKSQLFDRGEWRPEDDQRD